MSERVTNDFATVSSQALASNGLSLTVVTPPPSELLGGNFRVRIENPDNFGNPSGVNAEYLNVTDVSPGGTQWTVVRAAENPTRFPAASHSVGSVVTHVFTAEALSIMAVAGADGPPGPQGPAGPAGAASTVPGPQGPAGADGPTGPAGPQGPIGPEGTEGVQGPVGPTGPQGAAGSGVTMKGQVATSGLLPSSGNQQGDAYIVQSDDSLWIWNGTTWVSGGSIQGPPGAQGIQGVQGVAGAQGIQGIQGPDGPTGPQGIPGTTGSTGSTGPTGSTGAAGAPGSIWRSGTGAPSGALGVVGDWYENDANGDIYEKTGSSTYTLRDNLTGPTGATGSTGSQGIQGIQGPQGPSGQSAGKIFYLATSDASDISTYKTALTSPSAGAEQTITTNIPTIGTDVLVAVFATDPGVPGAIDFPAGYASRLIYANVITGGTVAKFHAMVYKRDAGGTETLIRDEFSAGFSDTTVSPQEWTATSSSPGSLLATDRLVFKLYAQRFSGGGSGSQVVSYFEGSAHASQVQTTISAGPQGPQGTTGATGPAGAPGSIWRSGTGAPSGALGIVGDWYENDANGDIYEKTGASAYTLRDNLTGPQGATGATGSTGSTGATGATGTFDPTTIANTQTANYTLVLTDAGKVIEMNSASATIVTVPPNSSVAFPTGTIIEVFRYGAGTVTMAPGSGVTLRSRNSLLAIGNQYGAISLRKRATDEWVMLGDFA